MSLELVDGQIQMLEAKIELTARDLRHGLHRPKDRDNNKSNQVTCHPSVHHKQEARLRGLS